MKLTTASVIAYCLLLCFSSVAQSRGDLVIIQAGKSNFKIVIPSQPAMEEQTAAKELQAYVHKITNVALPIVSEPQNAGKGIFVGKTNYASKAGIIDAREEAWIMKTHQGNLVLTGGGRRGTLYAVYHFLEDIAGIRWWSYWEEDVPKRSVLSVPAKIARNSVSLFKLRDIYDAVYLSSDSLKRVFPVRLRLNGRGDVPVSYGGAITFGKPAMVHSFSHYFPPDKYFSKHPDWFIYDKKSGKRIKTGQLCLSNPELLDSFKLKVADAISVSFAEADKKGRERPLLYSVSLNDNSTLCACNDCSQSIEKSGPSGYVLQFVNKIAAYIRPLYPEVKIETLSYLQYLEVPKDNTRPLANVLIRLADDERDILNPIEHANNRDVLRRLNNWAAIVGKGNLMSWDYMLTYYMNPPLPNMFRIDDDARLLLNKKAWGYFIEIERPVTNDMGIMKYWVTAKILENPYRQAEQVIDEFINGYYGPAAKYMREYLYTIKSAADSSGMGLTFKRNFVRSNYINFNVALKCHDLFEKALVATGSNADFKRRVSHARNGLDRVIVFEQRVFDAERRKRGIPVHDYTLSSEKAATRLVNSLTEMKAFTGNANDVTNMEITYFKALSHKYPLHQELKNIPQEKITVIRPEQLINAYNTVTLVEDAKAGDRTVARADVPVIKLPLQVRIIGRGINQNYQMDTERTFLIGKDSLNTNYRLHKIPGVKLKNNDHLILFYTWTVTADLGYHVKYGRPENDDQLYDIYVAARIDGPQHSNLNLKNEVLMIDAFYIVEK